jgi:hypothetical protein
LKSREYDVGAHDAGDPYTPLQQYWASANASHALRHATVVVCAAPASATRSSAGHALFRSAAHPVAWQLPLLAGGGGDRGATSMGTLKPSTKLTS